MKSFLLLPLITFNLPLCDPCLAHNENRRPPRLSLRTQFSVKIALLSLTHSSARAVSALRHVSNLSLHVKFPASRDITQLPSFSLSLSLSLSLPPSFCHIAVFAGCNSRRTCRRVSERASASRKISAGIVNTFSTSDEVHAFPRRRFEAW